MEEFVAEIRSYCAVTGVTPQSLLRFAINASGRTWDEWKDKKSYPRINTVEKVRAYMATHPPKTEVAR